MALLETAGVNLATSQALYDGSSGYRETDLYNAATRTFTEVVAATSQGWGGFYIWSKAEKVGWLSVAVGPAGSEVIIATIQVSFSAPRSFYVPIPVAAGTRVSVAHAGWTVGKLWAGVSGVPASVFDTVPSFTRLEVGPIYLDGGWTDYIYAVDVAAPGAANTKGAFTEISYSGYYSTPNNALNGDSLAQSYAYLGVDLLIKYNTGNALIDRLTDVAYGPAGSETVFVSDHYTNNISNWGLGSLAGPLWVKWGRPPGDRISVRYQVSDVSNDPGIYAILYGLR